MQTPLLRDIKKTSMPVGIREIFWAGLVIGREFAQTSTHFLY